MLTVSGTPAFLSLVVMKTSSVAIFSVLYSGMVSSKNGVFGWVLTAFVFCLLNTPSSAANESLLWRTQPSLDDVVGMDGSVFFQDIFDVLKVNEFTYIPVFYTFTSSPRQGSSLGSGWSLPILDAKIFQMDTDEFKVTFPDGKTTTVKRNKNEPHKLSGCIAEGTVSDSNIDIKSCEWRFIYSKGLLSRMVAPDGSVLSITRGSDGSAEIRSAGRLILKATIAKETSRLDSIMINGRSLHFDYTKRAIFGEINGQKVVLSTDLCLSSIFDENKISQTFAYSTELDGTLKPQFIIDGRVLEWDLNSNRLVRDGDSKVDVKVGEQNVIELTRTRGNGDVAWIKRDDLHKVFECRDFSGRVINWRAHSSGQLAGSLRNLNITGSDGKQILEHFIYDENAQLVQVRTQFDK